MWVIDILKVFLMVLVMVYLVVLGKILKVYWLYLDDSLLDFFVRWMSLRMLLVFMSYF